MKNKKESLPKYDYDKIFHMYTKYRFSTYSNIMTYDNQIFKFKENIHSYNKILKEMEHSLLPRKQNADQVQIYIKEDKKIKKYEEKSLSDKNSSNSEENYEKEKEHQKTKSEPKIEIEENTDKNDNNTTKKEKTFCIMGHFPDFVEALTKRNWKQITDSDKLNYDLLIALKITDVPFDLLDENITINHLRKIGELTKKTGLLKNLRNLYYLNISPDDFYPRAYDISERQDIQDFIEDFKVSKAISLLRKCQELNGKNVNKKEIVFDIPKISDEDWEIISNENITFYKEQISRMQRSGLIPKEAKLVTNTVVNNNNKNNNRTNKPNLNNKNKKGKKDTNNNSYIQNEEDKKLIEEIKADFIQKEKERIIENEKLDKIIQEKEEERLKYEQELEAKKKLEEEKKLLKTTEPPKVLTKEEIEQKWKEETFLNNTSSNQRPPRLPQTDDVSDLIPEIAPILEKLQNNFPQYAFSGDRNIWIVKPSGLSRGRGISCIDQLNDILSNIKTHNQNGVFVRYPLHKIRSGGFSFG